MRQITRTAWALIVIHRSRSSSIESRSCSRIRARSRHRQLEDAIGERRLAVVDVRDDRKLRSVFAWVSQRSWRALRAGIATIATPRAREGRARASPRYTTAATANAAPSRRPARRDRVRAARRGRATSRTRPAETAPAAATRPTTPAFFDVLRPTRRRIITRRTTAATTFTVDVASGMPQIRAGRRRCRTRRWRHGTSAIPVDAVRLHAAKLRLRMSIQPLKTRPIEKRLQALGDDHGVLGGELTALVDEADDRLREDDREEPGGNQRNAICRRPPSSTRRRAAVSLRAASRASVGNRTVVTATAKTLREHVQPKRLVDGRRRELRVEQPRRRACRRGSSR